MSVLLRVPLVPLLLIKCTTTGAAKNSHHGSEPSVAGTEHSGLFSGLRNLPTLPVSSHKLNICVVTGVWITT